MKTIRITICSCNKYVENNQWKKFSDLDSLVSKKVREIIPRSKVSYDELIVPENLKETYENLVSAAIKDREDQVKIIFKLSKCNLCDKEGSQYFESVFQIRCDNFAILQKTLDHIKERVASLRDKGLFINKAEPLKDGYDLYLTNKRLAVALGNELHDKHGGVLKVSPQLFSRNSQTSKDIYRVNILLRLPDFEKGDIIAMDNAVFRVDKLGKKIKLIGLLANKNVVIDFSKMSYELLKKHETYISKIRPTLEVINPFDFQSSIVRNPEMNRYAPGEKVKVVVYKGVYIV